MSSRWRRYEVQLTLKFNDGRSVPEVRLADAAFEVADHFNSSSLETQKIQGLWRHQGLLYRDESVRLVVDVPDTAANRRWMKGFKNRWKKRLEQLELWMISYPVNVE